MTGTSVLMVFLAGTSSETKKGKRAVSVQCSEQEESALPELPRWLGAHLKHSLYFNSRTLEDRRTNAQNQ